MRVMHWLAPILIGVATLTCGGDRGGSQVGPDGGAVYGPGSPDPGGRQFGSAPRFEDYPALVQFRGVPVPPDLSGHPEAARFGSAITRAVARGPNFAGRYTLVSRSCGSLCREFVIVDAETGRIFPGLTDAPPFEFRSDSRLIVFEAPQPLPGRLPCAGCSAAYYVWENDELVLIPPETWVGSAPPPPDVRALIDKVRAEERTRVESGPTVSRPTWDRLVIAARDGTRQVLADQLVRDAVVRVYVYRGFIDALDHHLIEVIHFEGGGNVIVDANTGNVLELDGPPVVAPDRTRFITTSVDLVAGHNPNRIRIYRRSGSGWEVEWSLAPADWGASSPRWLDDRTIVFDRERVDFRTRPLTMRREPGQLVRGETGWSLTGRR